MHIIKEARRQYFGFGIKPSRGRPSMQDHQAQIKGHDLIRVPSFGNEVLI